MNECVGRSALLAGPGEAARNPVAYPVCNQSPPIDGAPSPVHLAGLKDVVLVEDTVELLVPFNIGADKDHPFMTHCHILEHEDAGMMAQFTVV